MSSPAIPIISSDSTKRVLVKGDGKQPNGEESESSSMVIGTKKVVRSPKKPLKTSLPPMGSTPGNPDGTVAVVDKKRERRRRRRTSVERREHHSKDEETAQSPSIWKKDPIKGPSTSTPGTKSNLLSMKPTSNAFGASFRGINPVRAAAHERESRKLRMSAIAKSPAGPEKKSSVAFSDQTKKPNDPSSSLPRKQIITSKKDKDLAVPGPNDKNTALSPSLSGKPKDDQDRSGPAGRSSHSAEREKKGQQFKAMVSKMSDKQRDSAPHQHRQRKSGPIKGVNQSPVVEVRAPVPSGLHNLSSRLGLLEQSYMKPISLLAEPEDDAPSVWTPKKVAALIGIILLCLLMLPVVLWVYASAISSFVNHGVAYIDLSKVRAEQLEEEVYFGTTLVTVSGGIMTIAPDSSSSVIKAESGEFNTVSATTELSTKTVNTDKISISTDLTLGNSTDGYITMENTADGVEGPLLTVEGSIVTNNLEVLEKVEALSVSAQALSISPTYDDGDTAIAGFSDDGHIYGQGLILGDGVTKLTSESDGDRGTYDLIVSDGALINNDLIIENSSGAAEVTLNDTSVPTSVNSIKISTDRSYFTNVTISGELQSPGGLSASEMVLTDLKLKADESTPSHVPMLGLGVQTVNDFDYDDFSSSESPLSQCTQTGQIVVLVKGGTTPNYAGLYMCVMFSSDSSFQLIPISNTFEFEKEVEVPDYSS
ncbi:hypothetical protein ADUPG1_007923 [Aduncisulcus paluster]|uniref:Uncharacterized protein n=1 Tax=Aduncisulcus paluster TaxID=2918883 RepID=A0ABQ5KQ30_9EUKA|nr:hypothetical protein ADUPG1_007923 [Aduncisulcus paluster]